MLIVHDLNNNFHLTCATWVSIHTSAFLLVMFRIVQVWIVVEMVLKHSERQSQPWHLLFRSWRICCARKRTNNWKTEMQKVPLHVRVQFYLFVLEWHSKVWNIKIWQIWLTFQSPVTLAHLQETPRKREASIRMVQLYHLNLNLNPALFELKHSIGQLCCRHLTLY